jgi:uncharacterized protein (DUF58 family)
VNTGNNLLFLVVSALLGFMTLSGILGWLNIRGLGMRIEVPDEIYRGIDTLVTVRLANHKHLPSFLLKVSVCGTSIDFHLLDRGGEESRAVVVRFPERGRLRIAMAEICSPFPVNFFVRCTRLIIDREILVFPAPASCPVAGNAGRTSDSGAVPKSAKGYEGEMAKIADYSGGEPLKLIHWRLSARHGALKVKELTATAQEPVVLDVETLAGRDVEGNLSCAAFLVNRLIRANRPVGLRLRDRMIAPAVSRAHRLRLLAELAVYDQD